MDGWFPQGRRGRNQNVALTPEAAPRPRELLTMSRLAFPFLCIATPASAQHLQRQTGKFFFGRRCV